MKRSDIFVVGIILIVALSVALFTMKPNEETSKGKYISIQIDGEEVEQIEWSKENINKEFRFEGIKGYNIIQVGKSDVKMIEANCPDQICVHNAPIKEVGEMIVCLPHRVIVEIKEDNRTSDLDIMLR